MDTVQWINTMPVISTAHVTTSTMRQLERGEDNEYGLLCAPYELGAFVRLNRDGLSDDLGAILNWLLTDPRFADHMWIRLDADGDTIDALPVYDW